MHQENIKSYLDSLKEKISNKNYLFIERSLKKFDNFFCNKRLSNILDKDLSVSFNEYLKEELNFNATSRYFIALHIKKWFEYLKTSKINTPNIDEFYTNNRKKYEERKVLTGAPQLNQNDSVKILRLLEDRKDYSLIGLRDTITILMLFETGFNISTLTSLKRSNINFETKTIDISETINISISEKLLSLLKVYFSDRLDSMPYVLISFSKNNKNTLPLRQRSVQRIVSKLRKEASISSGITPKAFRNTKIAKIKQALKNLGLKR